MSLSQIRSKRNALVHEGDVELTTDETNMVKVLLEDLIMKYVEKGGDWEQQDFLFFFEHGQKSEKKLDQMVDKRNRELELIEEIRGGDSDVEEADGVEDGERTGEPAETEAESEKSWGLYSVLSSIKNLFK